MHHLPSIRFIPAGTGNSFYIQHSRLIAAVHPRRYGELNLILSSPCSVRGSSPQVRGTLPGEATPSPTRRFIPAGTGNSCQTAGRRPPGPVHPRRYGELLILSLTTIIIDGSSPQVRGTLTNYYVKTLCIRFIPAGTGNSRRGRPLAGRVAVHPRRYGEL